MRTVAARDHNEPDIVEALRKEGYFVTPLSDGGVPDLLVIRPSEQVPAFVTVTVEGALFAAKNNPITLIEVKQKKGSLTKAQREWFRRAYGHSK